LNEQDTTNFPPVVLGVVRLSWPTYNSFGRKSWKFRIVQSDRNLGIGNVIFYRNSKLIRQISLFLLTVMFKSSNHCIRWCIRWSCQENWQRVTHWLIILNVNHN